jgi:hypothetical protein
MSGLSNVICWLEERGIEPEEDLVQALFQRAKGSDRILGEEECHEVIESRAGVSGS